MMGRITQGMMNTQLLSNLNNNLNRMNEYQNQLATTRRINKPSDDPVGITFSLRYRSDLGSNDQYQKNVNAAISWMEFNDTMLNQTTEVLHRVRELSVLASNGTNTDTSLDAVKKELFQLTNQLVTVGNTQFNGKYVFNGQKTDLAPYQEGITEPNPNDPDSLFVVNAKSNSCDEGEIKLEIATSVTLSMNVQGNSIFGVYTPPVVPLPGDPPLPAGPIDDSLYKLMEDILNTLHKNDNKGMSDALARLDSRMDKIIGVRADIGAKLNRIQLASDRLQDINLNVQSLLSKTEDADMPALITNMKTSESVYQASLSVGTKIISPSLVDFLR
ncbi:flagellar hook-associated protein FlgL [Paenibacillus eucommiae]|uniref:Flagellar hook-associated protein 3 FlgL n=1 Tax=Paenibacillus eucommiae TaxID=1355755 RepID=A0ABS4J071_9BACL|nr:flagellar hook-associated protein FlgL [Paenibacillus eucommiae]MBP1992641.1 flagellar hook-associated protein 3 FlgL [Paenibacillus eucommiae]